MRGLRGRGLSIPIARRFRDGGGSPYLLDYSQATFSRTTEAAFQDPREDWQFKGGSESENWKPANKPRIFSDGAILIEGSRTNLTIQSELVGVTSAWNAGGTNASASNGTVIAPDLGADAGTIYFQDATANPQWRQNVAAANFTNDLSSSISAWVRHTGSASETDQFRILWRGKDGATVVRSSPLDFGTQWVRHSIAVTNASGSTACLNGPWYTTDPGVIRGFHGWGAQIEADSTFPSSYIRTTTATATRGADLLSFSADRYDLNTFVSSGFEFDLYPGHSNADTQSSAQIILRYTTTTAFLIHWVNAAVIRVNINGGTPAELTFGSLVYSKHQKLTVRVDMQNRTVTLSGFTSGNATQSFPNAFDPGDPGTLYIGRDNFGAMAFYGVISRLRRIR